MELTLQEVSEVFVKCVECQSPCGVSVGIFACGGGAGSDKGFTHASTVTGCGLVESSLLSGKVK